jgi:hypothetical protein
MMVSLTMHAVLLFLAKASTAVPTDAEVPLTAIYCCLFLTITSGPYSCIMPSYADTAIVCIMVHYKLWVTGISEVNRAFVL